MTKEKKKENNIIEWKAFEIIEACRKVDTVGNIHLVFVFLLSLYQARDCSYFRFRFSFHQTCLFLLIVFVINQSFERV